MLRVALRLISAISDVQQDLPRTRDGDPVNDHEPANAPAPPPPIPIPPPPPIPIRLRRAHPAAHPAAHPGPALGTAHPAAHSGIAGRGNSASQHGLIDRLLVSVIVTSWRMSDIVFESGDRPSRMICGPA